ncbi:hypothetical protein HK102_005632 [Quaeritorhiza haematococci]|nr:hypothetical protein HK102_005632 [Quaeritorhiza haematococci]
MPCKCGATDHSRTSSKKCSLHFARPGAPELFKPVGVRSSLNCTVYKTTLSQLLGRNLNEHQKRLQDQIESTVQTLTLASFHASIDLERHVRAFNPLKRPLEDDEDDQPQDVDQAQDVPPKFKNKFIRKLFSKHGPKGVALSYAVKDYMTNLENHFRLQIGRCYRKVADIMATRIIATKKGKKAKNTLKWAFINDPELFQSVFSIQITINTSNDHVLLCLARLDTCCSCSSAFRFAGGAVNSTPNPAIIPFFNLLTPGELVSPVAPVPVVPAAPIAPIVKPVAPVASIPVSPTAPVAPAPVASVPISPAAPVATVALVVSQVAPVASVPVSPATPAVKPFSPVAPVASVPVSPVAPVAPAVKPVSPVALIASAPVELSALPVAPDKPVAHTGGGLASRLSCNNLCKCARCRLHFAT